MGAELRHAPDMTATHSVFDQVSMASVLDEPKHIRLGHPRKRSLYVKVCLADKGEQPLEAINAPRVRRPGRSSSEDLFGYR